MCSPIRRLKGLKPVVSKAFVFPLLNTTQTPRFVQLSPIHAQSDGEELLSAGIELVSRLKRQVVGLYVNGRLSFLVGISSL